MFQMKISTSQRKMSMVLRKMSAVLIKISIRKNCSARRTFIGKFRPLRLKT